MAEFSIEELEAAEKALTSSVHKIEQVQKTLSAKQPLPKSQLTLAARNLNALKISLTLIAREKENIKRK